MAWTVLVDTPWSAAQVVVYTYVVNVDALGSVVVRLLVANGATISVGDGGYSSSEGVGRVPDALNDSPVCVTNSDDGSSEGVSFVGYLLDNGAIGVSYGNDGVAIDVYLNSVSAGYATVVVGILNYLISKSVGIAARNEVLGGGHLNCECSKCQK